MGAFLEFLIGMGFHDMILNAGTALFKIAIVVGIVMLFVAYATYFERKVIGHMQVRMGPTRVGPLGLLQPIADGLKLFFKEDIIPSEADKPVFYIAPVIPLFAAMSSLAFIPFYRGFAIADVNISLLFILALSSLGAYGVIMSGWASNSKYAFLGGLRASAQVISYEISMGLSLVGVMIMSGSLNLNEIALAQQSNPDVWYGKVFIIPQLLGAAVFFVAALAETNRAPFDLPEAETELVAGYFTEYSGFRFSLFFMAEYIGMIMMALVGSFCFLGGWYTPTYFAFLTKIPYIGNFVSGVFWIALKVGVFMFLYYWIRATLPRYRYDQLMNIGWKVLIPLALFNIVLTATLKILL